MQVADIMNCDVAVVGPDATLCEAAAQMRDHGCRCVAVGENDLLIGVLTDWDIVVHAVADGKAPADCRVRDAMSGGILYCYEDDDVLSAARTMRARGVRRLPVLNRSKQLVGMVSIEDLALCFVQGTPLPTAQNPMTLH